MKRILLLLILVVFMAALCAQNVGPKSDMYKTMSHHMGEYQFDIENFMRQHDGDFIFNTFVSLEGPEPWSPIDVGNIVYKMSSTTLTFTDSLLVEDPEAPFCLFAPNPNGEGNIRANFEYNEECDSTFLRICHFPDDDLAINHDEDIVVPVCEGFAGGNFDSHMVDCRGNLIMKYSKMRPDGGHDEYIARFAPDGTLKHQTLLFESQDIVIPKLRVFNESPLQYYQWRSYNNGNLLVITMDSLFQKNNIMLNKVLSEESLSDTMYLIAREYFTFNVDTEVIPVGGNDILVAAEYRCDTNNNPLTAENGVAIVKYDLRTFQKKEMVVFNDFPGSETESVCLGLGKMPDGTVYFLYREIGYPDGNIVAVKMDVGLNVEWKRFFKTDNFTFHWRLPLYFPITIEGGQDEEQGIAWAGYGRTSADDVDLVYFFLNHDGTVGVNESGIEVRPYSYYPNPTHDQLRLQYSPDVQPRQIELYDLQGRLVRMQRTGLESIDMSQLPAGTYTMRVALEDGKTFSDKVVKE